MNIIYKTNPRHTEENVPVDKTIEVYFMIDMNKNTFKPETVILFNLTEQLVESVTFEYARRILWIKPVGKLNPNNQYQLQLLGGEKGLRDITGRQMAQTYELEFHTKDVEEVKPPRILSPTDLTVVREAIAVQLELNLDVDYYELQISKSNVFHNLVWPTNEEKVYRTPEINIIPDISYETGTYYLRARSIDFDGKASSWSSSIRYHYDGAPIIQIPEEEPLPDEQPVESSPIESGTVEVQSKRVILQARTQLQSQPNQLSTLQNVFTAKEGTALTGLYIKSTTPKDTSVNNNVEKFNDTRTGMNGKRIVIEFTDDIDPTAITTSTCYVLSERN